MTYNLATLTRPEKVRNIMDPPIMSDEPMLETPKERKERKDRAWRLARKRARQVQMIY